MRFRILFVHFFPHVLYLDIYELCVAYCDVYCKPFGGIVRLRMDTPRSVGHCEGPAKFWQSSMTFPNPKHQLASSWSLSNQHRLRQKRQQHKLVGLKTSVRERTVDPSCGPRPDTAELHSPSHRGQPIRLVDKSASRKWARSRAVSRRAVVGCRSEVGLPSCGA